MLSENTGQPYEKVAADTERDNYMSAQEAKEYGLVDEVITYKKQKYNSLVFPNVYAFE